MKDVTYCDIKIHRKPGTHPFYEEDILGKTTEGGGQFEKPIHPAFLGLREYLLS